MSLRLAVATEDFGAPLKKAIARAAACEVQGVRLNSRTELNALNTSDSANRQILLYVKERQMRIAGLACSTRHSLYDAEYLEPRLEVIRKSMSLVRQFETEELLIRCGQIPNAEDDTATEPTSKLLPEDAGNPFLFASPGASTPSPAAQFSTLCEILNDLTAYGNHVGCTLTLQVASYDSPLIKRLMNEVTAGPLRLVFDPATVLMTGAVVDQTYRDIYAHVGYIRARDAVRNTDGAGTEVGVGRGIVDWPQLLPTLDEADFQGWVCVERTGGDDRRADVETGVSYLKSLIPHSGD